MRLVVAAPQAPLREGGAAGRATVALLRGLKANGVDVHAIAPVYSALDEAVPSDIDIELVPVDLAGRGGVAGAVDRIRRPIYELADSAFAAHLHEATATADVVHLEQIETACFGPAAAPTLLHLHYRALLDAPLGAPWRRAFRHRLEFASAERRAVDRFDWLLSNSEDVAVRLRSDRPDAQVQTTPLPLDPADYPVAAPVDEPIVGVIGTAAWMPTAVALSRLLRSVWPSVTTRAPDAKLRIAGRGTGELTVNDPTVEVWGEVESAAEFLSGLGLLIYAAPRGSGTKVKVLEALACGIPVVTSPSGAEGIEPHDGVVVCRTDVALADACIELLRHPEQRAERGRAGRGYIERRHAPIPATRPLLALYEQMLAAR